MGSRAIKLQPCPYEDCAGGKVWYWGWYRGREGKIPLEPDRVCEFIPLRRFQCQGCKRSFSWRPSFLAFGRSLAAIVYARTLKCWCWHRPVPGASDWYELSLVGRKSFYRVLRGRCEELLIRFGVPSGPSDRQQMWFLTRRLSAPSRHSIHALCLLLATPRGGARYRPQAA